MELTIWFVAIIIAVIALIFSIVSIIKTLELSKQVDELDEWLDVLTNLTVDTFEELEENVDKKFEEVYSLFDNNHIIHDKIIEILKSLMETDQSLYEYIKEVEKTEEFDKDDLYELFTGFFGEEVDETELNKGDWEHPVDDSDVVCWSCSKVWEDDKYEYWETRETKRFEKGCPRYPECKKEPCKDTCPKKRGRPAKK